ncbi:MAG: hypothetical protein Q7S11_00115 [bacterium]|nr:hypothetical protein [bacterium]
MNNGVSYINPHVVSSAEDELRFLAQDREIDMLGWEKIGAFRQMLENLHKNSGDQNVQKILSEIVEEFIFFHTCKRRRDAQGIENFLNDLDLLIKYRRISKCYVSRLYGFCIIVSLHINGKRDTASPVPQAVTA